MTKEFLLYNVNLLQNSFTHIRVLLVLLYLYIMKIFSCFFFVLLLKFLHDNLEKLN